MLCGLGWLAWTTVRFCTVAVLAVVVVVVGLAAAAAEAANLLPPAADAGLPIHGLAERGRACANHPASASAHGSNGGPL